MLERTKKLLIALFISIIILALSIIFRPLEPEEETPEDFQEEMEEMEDPADPAELPM